MLTNDELNPLKKKTNFVTHTHSYRNEKRTNDQAKGKNTTKNIIYSTNQTRRQIPAKEYKGGLQKDHRNENSEQAHNVSLS